ncbi:hypothetical protein RvY_10590-3 [Ramazzottius varieornatus]|uniref:Chromo domain-containing protein n=1 Tax=Ramazzottius varieornatus TaxID=947166 RepID=A0A1D1VFC6_RAMVA|nr:hypothetical protein RvY_10590-3 [Ramazzottius varieornatus]
MVLWLHPSVRGEEPRMSRAKNFDESVDEVEQLPPFRGPSWPVEKLLARRNSHLVDKDGNRQLDYLVKWENRDVMMSTWVAEEYLESKDVVRWKDRVKTVSSSDEESSTAEEVGHAQQTASTDSDEDRPMMRIPRKSLVNSRGGSPVPTARRLLNENFSQDESGDGDDEDEEDEETESLNGFVVDDDVVIYSDREEDEEEEFSTQPNSARDRYFGHSQVSGM